MRRLVSTALLAALAVTPAGCGWWSDDDARPLPEPTGPPPTTVPQPDEPGEPGTLLDARERADEPADRRSWAIVYASTTTEGDPVAVTGQVVAPAGAPPDGGWPVVAWAHPTTGTSDRCTPSQQGPRSIHNVDELVAAGIAVVATDYQGLGTEGPHPYLVGPAAAHDVLDAVRAAASIDGAGISTDSPIVIAGFSQGGHAALWAAQLAPDHAPELDVVGVQAVAPVTDVTQFARRAEGMDAQFGVLATIVHGFAAAYPDLDPADVLAEPALDRLYAAEDRCIDEVVVAFTRPVEEMLRESPLAHEEWSERLAENTAAQEGVGVPVHVVQGASDPIVYEQVTADAVARLCEAGDAVQYDVIPGADHGVLTPGRTMPWIEARFAGEDPPTNCPA